MKQNTQHTGITALLNRRTRWLSLVVCAAALAGCHKDGATSDNGDDGIPAAFSAGIHTATLPPASPDADPSDASNTAWAKDAAVGIFMLQAGEGISSGILPGADNIRYTVSPATGALAPATTPIYYPQTGTVDFIAYSPYAEKGTGDGAVNADYTYHVSLDDQTRPAAIDLLWAKTTGKERSKAAVELGFRHVLSRVVFNITTGDGLSGMTADAITSVTLSGMPASATLALNDGTLTPGALGDITALREDTPREGATATFTAVVTPQQSGAYVRTITVTVNGEEYHAIIPAGDGYTSDKMYVYPVTVQKTGITISTPTIGTWHTNNQGKGTAEFYYTVTFHANGGTGTVPAPLPEVGSTTGAPLPDGAGLTRDDGAVFDGWYNNNGNDETIYQPGETFKPTGPTTLSAHWDTSALD